jgi:hypothetical protein
MSRVTTVVVCATAMFLGAARVSADPVRITGGTLLVTGLAEPAPIAVVGTQGFAIGAIASPTEGRVDPFTECGTGCLPGTTVSLGGALLGALAGEVAFDGNTFPLVISTEAETVLNLEWTGTTMAPAESSGPVSVTGHFDLTGSLFHPQGVKLADIKGGGTATLFLDPNDVDPGFVWEINRVRYDFETAATPEPATLMLLTTGVLVGGLRRHVRRRAL